MISKKILIPMAIVAVIAAGGYGVAQVSAASSTAGTGQTLAQRIASAFGLDQSKVQSVIDQYRSDKQGQAETRYEAMLSQAVTDGKITSDQKSAILAEHNKLMGELQAASGTNHRAVMQQVRTEAEAWAKQNNLPAKWLLGGRPLRGMGPMMRHEGHGAAPSASPSVSPVPTPSTGTSPSPSA